jgi:hypothetical protein
MPTIASNENATAANISLIDAKYAAKNNDGTAAPASIIKLTSLFGSLLIYALINNAIISIKKKL